MNTEQLILCLGQVEENNQEVSFKDIRRRANVLFKELFSLVKENNIGLSQNDKQWLTDNLDTIKVFIKRYISCSGTISNRYALFFRKATELEDFTCEQDCIESIYSFLSGQTNPKESDVNGFPCLLAYYIAFHILRCVKICSSELIRYIICIHKMMQINFHLLELQFSPLDKILKQDPDATYSKMTRSTQLHYREQIKREAKRKKLKPEEFAALALKKAQKEKNHIGFYLNFKTKRTNYILYVLSLYFILLIYFACTIQNAVLTCFVLLPLYFFTKRFVDFIYGLLNKPMPLAALKQAKIEKEDQTCVIISSLITKESDIEQLVQKIKSYKINNYTEGDSVYFGLLCDLKEAEVARRAEDEGIISCLEAEIQKLNRDHPVFFACIRERVFHKCEGKYVGYERKRGAIEQLMAHFSGDTQKGLMFFGLCDELVGTRYLVTLDADTGLSIGQVARLVGIAKHPFNRPVYENKNGREQVISGHGILQPKIIPSLFEPIKTPLGKMNSNGGGLPVYATAGFDTMQSSLGEANFCGKGLIDVSAYLRTVRLAIPEQKILSHDMPEGSFCRCGLAESENFADSNPQSLNSYYKRQHRWIRGDVQNLILYPRLSLARQYFAFENLISYLVPVSELLLLAVSSAFGKVYATVCALLCLLFHFESLFITTTGLVLHGNLEHLHRRFATKMRNLVLNSFYQCFLSLSAIAFEAWYFSDAIIRALYRMLKSKKKLLEWEVYSPFSKSNSFIFYFPSVLLAIPVLMIGNNAVTRLVALLWLLFPVIAHLVSKPYDLQSPWSERELAQLKEYAREEFSFFEFSVGEKTNYLPPDNIQLEPCEKVAMRTSPTNMGLYLASLVCARKMELISTTEICRRLQKTLKTIQRLETWNGHLFNWYDLNTLGVIGDRFVSTVDSGNFVACAIFCFSALKHYEKEDGRIREILNDLQTIINRADFLSLLDFQKYLFKVGVFPDKKEASCGVYDHYMSEARITAFSAIALGKVSSQLWYNLSRPLLSFGGRVGVGSWSGTAFEYFMAPLFLPVVDNSMEDESLSFAHFGQKKSKVRCSVQGTVFGISESGYSLTDHDDNYQYKAFGVEHLSSQESISREKVISPYSSFLMLERGEKDVLENLLELEKIGLKGRFGFYEACEFHSNYLGDYSIVYSYMSHHKGMSVLSLCNAICDRYVQSEFMGYDNFSAKKELLAERFPIEGKILRKKGSIEITKRLVPNKKSSLYPVDETGKNANLITDGRSTILFYSNGDNRFLVGGSDLFDSENGGIQFKIKLGNHEFDWKDQRLEKKLRFGSNHLEMDLRYEKITVLIRIELISGNKAFLIRSEIQGTREKCAISLLFTAVLQNERVYRAHPAFQALSLEADRNASGFTICKRGDVKHSYLHCTSSQNFDVKLYGEPCELHFSKRPLIDGTITLTKSFEHGMGSKAYWIFEFSDSKTPKDRKSWIDGAYNLRSELLEKGYVRSARYQKLCFYDKKCFELEQRLLASLKNPIQMIPKDSLSNHPINSIWKYGISGDDPILSICVNHLDSSLILLVSQAIRVTKKLILAGIGIDLVFYHSSQRGYFDETRDRLTSLISKYKCEYLLGAKRGIHFICTNDQEELEVLKNLSFHQKEAPATSAKEEIVSEFKNKDSYSPVAKISKEEIVVDKASFDPPVPFSHVVSNHICGFVCNQNSLGFTWMRNAGLMRITKWDNLPKETDGEKIYLEVGDKRYDLLRIAEKVRYQRGFAVYEGKLQGEAFKVIATISHLTSGKIVFVSLPSSVKENAKLVYSFVPAMGSAPKHNVEVCLKEKMVSFAPVLSGEYDHFAYFGVREGSPAWKRWKDRLEITVAAKEENLMFLGAYTNEKHFQWIRRIVSTGSMEDLLQKERAILDLSIDPGADEKESWIRYQAVHARFYGRTGQYQSSGAYGFRDQLQDCLIFLKSNPEIVRNHLLRCAAHQFEEGDVQHWWHISRKDGKCDAGVRTLCSDDYLWLLYVAARYLEETLDHSILEYRVPFLRSEPLGDKAESYLTPEKGSSGTFREHLERAAYLYLNRSFGEHGLPMIGSGDWNDGMNRLDGESVWLGFFSSIALKGIMPYVSKEFRDLIQSKLRFLSESLEQAFNGSWFVRCYETSGRVLGSDITLESECSIDLITQAFSAFYYLAFRGTDLALDDKKVTSALEAAFEILSDEKHRTTALFRRPFSETEPTPGYIQRYAQGVRENGGQYTHAAVWFALALIRFGKITKNDKLIRYGIQVSERIDPFVNVSQEHFKRYQREPYVLCGDVYTAQGNRGHGGWSWYTGAAGWYLELMKELKSLKEKDKFR